MGKTFVRCEECGRQIPYHRLTNGFCMPCYSKKFPAGKVTYTGEVKKEVSVLREREVYNEDGTVTLCSSYKKNKIPISIETKLEKFQNKNFELIEQVFKDHKNFLLSE